jgi:hypothetical protein
MYVHLQRGAPVVVVVGKKKKKEKDFLSFSFLILPA